MIMQKLPVSIRTKNPGAQWPGRVATTYGSTQHLNLSDGNKIAIFPTYEQGGAALFALMEKGYAGMTFEAAIKKWSGGNSVNSYLKVIESKTAFNRRDYIDKDLLTSADDAISFARAMAWHEAGMEYPMTDDQWYAAHNLFLSKRAGEKVDIVKGDSGPQLGALEWAISHLGEKEIPGPEEANEFILQCFKDVGHDEITSDEVPWCAVFAGAALKSSGFKYIETMLARDYLKMESACEAEPGALIITRRGTSTWEGHIAIIEKVTPTHIHYVGGNQGNAVTRGIISRRDKKILGFRRPMPAQVTVRQVAQTDSGRYKAVGGLTTITALIWGWWNAIVNAIAHGVDFVASFFINLPEVSAHAVSTTTAAKNAVETAGLPWPITAALVITLAALALNFYETYRRNRKPTL